MALFPARTAWLLGVVAVGCVYPRLSSSPDWGGEDAAGGEPSQAGEGGSGQGGSGPSGGKAPSGGGAGATAPVGGEGGLPAVEEDIIHGIVVDQYDTPVPGIVVLIDDVELVTNESGEVSLADSGKQTFDVTVVDEASRFAYVYEGVTRRELRLGVSAPLEEDALHTANVSGTAEISFPEANLRVAYDDRRRAYGAIGVLNLADVAPSVRYDLKATWSGAEELEGQLSAINFVGSPIQNMPEDYEFVAVPLGLSAGDSKNVALKLAPLNTRKLDVSIDAPAGMTRFDTLLFGNFAFTNSSPTPSQTYVIPKDPLFDAAQLASYFALSCSSPAGSVNLLVPLNAETSDVDDECGTPPSLVSPPSGAADVTNSTPLVFEPELDGCHSFSISHQGSWSVLIFTMNREVVAPDLSKYGLSYAPHDVSWTAGSTSPCDGIDGYVAPDDSDAPAVLDYAVRADRSAGATFSTAN